MKHGPMWVITKGPKQSRVPGKAITHETSEEWVVSVMIVMRGKCDWMKEWLNEWNCCSAKNRSGAERGKSGSWENKVDKLIKNSYRKKNGAWEFSIEFDCSIRRWPAGRSMPITLDWHQTGQSVDWLVVDMGADGWALGADGRSQAQIEALDEAVVVAWEYQIFLQYSWHCAYEMTSLSAQLPYQLLFYSHNYFPTS